MLDCINSNPLPILLSSEGSNLSNGQNFIYWILQRPVAVLRTDISKEKGKKFDKQMKTQHWSSFLTCDFVINEVLLQKRNIIIVIIIMMEKLIIHRTTYHLHFSFLFHKIHLLTFHSLKNEIFIYFLDLFLSSFITSKAGNNKMFC